jgi:hypothetical protein
MKPTHSFIHITAVLLAFLFLGTLAPAPTITIDVLTTFDYPGTGNLTQPQKTNDAGEIAGEFVDSSGVERGFVRFRTARVTRVVYCVDIGIRDVGSGGCRQGS